MSTSCQFWITNNAGSDKIQLPVLPSEITITHNGNNDTVNVSGLGEVTIMQDRGAVVYEFKSIFPANWFQGCQYKQLREPEYYRKKLVEWKDSKKPVKFIITGSSVNLFCTIEKFQYSEKGGDPDTLHYTISLREFRAATVRKLDTTPPVQVPPAPAPKPATPTPTPTPAKPTYQKGKVKTNGSRLMLRQKASTSSKILKKMPNGSGLEIISKSGSWYKVIYQGTTGYAYAQWVKKL